MTLIKRLALTIEEAVYKGGQLHESDIAIAVLAAMREPTPEMIAAVATVDI